MIAQLSNKIERCVAQEIWQKSLIKLLFPNFISMLIISCLYSWVLAEGEFLALLYIWPYEGVQHISNLSWTSLCHWLLQI